MPYFYGQPEPKLPAGSAFKAALKDSTAPEVVPKNPTTGMALPSKSRPVKVVVYGTSYVVDGFLTVRRRREHRANMHRWS